MLIFVLKVTTRVLKSKSKIVSKVKYLKMKYLKLKKEWTTRTAKILMENLTDMGETFSDTNELIENSLMEICLRENVLADQVLLSVLVLLLMATFVFWYYA